MNSEEKQRLETLVEALDHVLDIGNEILHKHPYNNDFDSNLIRVLNDIQELRSLVVLERELQAKEVIGDRTEDKSFQAHDDAISLGCVMCGNEWKSLNSEGYCSSCYQVYNS